MSETKHTPGEWRPGRHSGELVTSKKPEWWREDDYDGVDYYGGYLIAESIGNPHDRDLMVAAPDLLAALEKARIALMFYREEMARDVPGKDYPYGIECESEARAAVAKAKGETV